MLANFTVFNMKVVHACHCTNSVSDVPHPLSLNTKVLINEIICSHDESVDRVHTTLDKSKAHLAASHVFSSS